jgi:hypothetical protein
MGSLFLDSKLSRGSCGKDSLESSSGGKLRIEDGREPESSEKRLWLDFEILYSGVAFPLLLNGLLMLGALVGSRSENGENAGDDGVEAYIAV